MKQSIADVEYQVDVAVSNYKIAKNAFNLYMKRLCPNEVKSPGYEEIRSSQYIGNDAEQIAKIVKLHEELELRKKVMIFNQSEYKKLKNKYKNKSGYSTIERIIIEENREKGLSLKDISEKYKFNYDYVRHVSSNIEKNKRKHNEKHN